MSRDHDDAPPPDPPGAPPEELLRQLVEHGRQGLAVMQDHRFRYANPAFAEIMGRGSAELCALSPEGVLDLIHPEHRERIAAAIEERLSGRVPEGQQEFRIQHPDGGVRWIATRGRTVVLDGGNALLLGIEDITERREAEAKLHESEARFRALTEHSPNGIYQTDLQGRCEYVNARWCEMAGLTPEAALGDGWKQGLHPEDREEVFAAWKRMAASEGAWGHQYRFQDRAGKTTWVRGVAHPIRGPDGEILGYVGTNMDITSAMEAEQELREERDRVRAILDASPDAIIQTDLTGVVTACNQACLELLGRTDPADLVGHNSLDFLVPEERGKTDARRDELLATGRQLAVPYRLVRPDGRERLIEASSTLLRDADGAPQGFVGVVHDVTRQRAAEAQIRESREELRRLTVGLQREIEKVRTHIAREIHDDLGQLLTALKMDLSWIERHLPFQAGTPQRERAAAAITLVEQLTGRVREIAAELRPGPLEHLGLCAAIEWQAEQFSRHAGIPCRVSPGADRPPLDFDRSTAVFRAVQEALTNVARHAQATEVRIHSTLTDDTFTIELHDDGRGFDSTARRRTGPLGLLGMRERVLEFGGELDIESRPGEGTTVRIRMPVPAGEGET